MLCGMDKGEIFKAVTYNPAKALGMEAEIGTLEPGSRADIAILDMVPSDQIFFDRFGNQKRSKEVLVPMMTLRKGKAVFRQSFFF